MPAKTSRRRIKVERTWTQEQNNIAFHKYVLPKVMEEYLCVKRGNRYRITVGKSIVEYYPETSRTAVWLGCMNNPTGELGKPTYWCTIKGDLFFNWLGWLRYKI